MRQVQISCDICTGFARYLYSTKQSWIIKSSSICLVLFQVFFYKITKPSLNSPSGLIDSFLKSIIIDIPEKTGIIDCSVSYRLLLITDNN